VIRRWFNYVDHKVDDLMNIVCNNGDRRNYALGTCEEDLWNGIKKNMKF